MTKKQTRQPMFGFLIKENGLGDPLPSYAAIGWLDSSDAFKVYTAIFILLIFPFSLL